MMRFDFVKGKGITDANFFITEVHGMLMDANLFRAIFRKH